MKRFLVLLLTLTLVLTMVACGDKESSQNSLSREGDSSIAGISNTKDSKETDNKKEEKGIESKEKTTDNAVTTRKKGEVPTRDSLMAALGNNYRVSLAYKGMYTGVSEDFTDSSELVSVDGRNYYRFTTRSFYDGDDTPTISTGGLLEDAEFIYLYNGEYEGGQYVQMYNKDYYEAQGMGRSAMGEYGTWNDVIEYSIFDYSAYPSKSGTVAGRPCTIYTTSQGTNELTYSIDDEMGLCMKYTYCSPEGLLSGFEIKEFSQGGHSVDAYFAENNLTTWPGADFFSILGINEIKEPANGKIMEIVTFDLDVEEEDARYYAIWSFLDEAGVRELCKAFYDAGANEYLFADSNAFDDLFTHPFEDDIICFDANCGEYGRKAVRISGSPSSDGSYQITIDLS